MKRSIAILLTAVMVLGIIPASMLTALGHGIGVGNNATQNVSIDNAPNQKIPATVTVDGKSDDTAWAYEDWCNVNSTTGIWSETTSKNPNFSYKYQLHVDYEYLYGIFVIDTNAIFSGEVGDITVWLNDSGETKYTDKIVITLDGSCTIYNGSSAASDKGEGLISEKQCKVTSENGVYTVEFRTLISNVAESVDALTSYVSVKVSDQSLYYPRFATDDTDTNINPETAWPINAVAITRWDIAASNQAGEWGTQNGDFSKILPSEIHVDGELNEGIWESFTDYYRTDSDPFEYRNDTDAKTQDGYEFADLAVGYSDSMYFYRIEDGEVNVPRENILGDTVLNDPVYFTTNENGNAVIDGDRTEVKNYYYDAQYLDFGESPLKFKYDIRASSEYLYGAVMASVDCHDTNVYYHLKDFEDEVIAAGETMEAYDGHVMTVPVYFFVVFDSSDADAAYELKVRYNTQVKYSARLGVWEFFRSEEGGVNTSVCSFRGGIAEQIPAVNKESYASAQRLGRYLISMEFCMPLAEIGLLDASTGLYYNASTGKYDATSIDIKHTVAMANTPSMYDYYVKDVEESSETVSKTITYYSYGYKDESTGEVISYQSTDDGVVQGAANKYCKNEGTFSFSYFKTFDAGLYTYHAWSLGGGMVSSKPVTASKDSAERNPEDLKIDGSLESTYWANLLAADAKINSMGRAHSEAVGVDDKNEFIGKGEADATDGVIGTFYHEVAMDDEYLYGAAMIIDGDGEWLVRSSDTSYDMFKLWINNGVKYWTESYDYAINFYMDSTRNSDVPNIPVCEIYSASDWNNPIATSVSANVADANIADTTNAQLNGHGIEVAMRVVDYQLRDIAKTQYQGGPESGYHSVDLAVLEFKIPLSLIGISGQRADIDATSYMVSKELRSDGGAKGLCWPLVDNAELINLGIVNGDATRYDDVMYINPWNTHYYESASISMNDRIANTVTVDGNLAEEIWNNEDERITVDSTVGTWDVLPLGEKEIADYSFKVYTGRNYVYGAAVINSELNEGEAFTLWINADSSSSATHKFEFMIENGEGVCYKTDAAGNRTKVSFIKNITVPDYYIDGNDPSKGYVYFNAVDGGMGMHAMNGKTTLEFMLPMSEFETPVNRTTLKTDGSVLYEYEYFDGFEYCVSVTKGGHSLFYPDNSNIENTTNTETLWLTHYNVGTSGGGIIVNSPVIAQSFNTAYYRRAFFSPTEYEGIYKLDLYTESSDTLSYLYDEWVALYGSAENIPEGSFAYLISNGNVSSTPVGEFTKSNTLNYNALAMNRFRDQLKNNNGCYVRFTGIDLDGQSLNTVYNDQWNSDIKYQNYGYFTDATLTVVSLDNIRNASYPDYKWDFDNDKTIESVGYFVPEKITVDGDITDSGWDADKWIEVIEGANGISRNSQYNYCDSDLNYKYQIRIDNEYVYVAAVMDTPAAVGAYGDGNGVYSDTKQATPAFRIWIQSQNEKYDEAISFTHLFDVRPGSTNLYGFEANVNEEINDYKTHYFPTNSENDEYVAADGETSIELKDDGSINWGYIGYPGITIRATENVGGLTTPKGGSDGTVVNKTYGDTAFYGETLFNAENLSDGDWPDYQSKWFASVDVKEYVFGNEHAVFKACPDDSDKMQVEFKFALADIGCENGEGFEYYVEARSEQPDEGDSFINIYPSIPIESCVYDGDYARVYYFPSWVWGNTAAVVNKEARESMKLRNPQEPLSALGAQYMESYEKADGTTTKALRFGILYNQKYLDNAHNDGATYWDVKDIGVLLASSKRLGLNSDGSISLTTDTAAARRVDADAILNHQTGTNMADYESYVAYVILAIPDSQVDSNVTYRGFVEFYPSDDIYYDHWWLTDGTEDDDVEGYTYRPTYYADTLTRNYNTVVKYSDENGDEIGAGTGETEGAEDVDHNGTIIAYVPLDDRPVNYDRAEYLAAAAGVKLVMPPKDVIRTLVDTDADTTTNRSDQGNPMDVLEWLRTDEYASVADYYVLSLDQMFSGGLVGSRDPFYDSAYTTTGLVGEPDSIATLAAGNTLLASGSYVLSAEEKEIANYIMDLSQTNKVVLFDTVMRLATTGNYGNANDSSYATFRGSFANTTRAQLYGDDLTIEKIVAGYNYDADGNYIAVDASNELVKQSYVLARERKLRLVDYLVKGDKNSDGIADVNILGNLQGFYVGVDDSSDDLNIQRNEMRYVTEKLLGGYDNAILFAGADELGLMGISDIVTYLHGEVTVNLQYFGNGKGWIADDFDPGVLSDCVEAHIDAVGGVILHDTVGANDYTDADMDILVLTRSGGYSYDLGANATQHAADVEALMAKLEYNLENNIPTCVIDGSAYAGYGALADAMFAADISLTEVLGFSAWNTTGNAVGISLANAVARASYLKNSLNVTKESHKGFVQSIVYSYIKDDVYKLNSAACYKDAYTFYELADEWLAKINADNHILTSIHEGKGISEDRGYDIRISDLHFPWDRDFEADFEISFIADGSDNNTNLLTSLSHSTLTGTENYATFAASGWYWGHETGNNDTTDSNTAPWSTQFVGNLTDGVTRNDFGFGENNVIAKAAWYGMKSRGEEENLETPDGVCNLPSIKFAETRDIDEVRIHWLYYLDGSVYLPQKVKIVLRDKDGGLIATETMTDIRDAESRLGSEHTGYWLNFKFTQAYADVATVTIRPYAHERIGGDGASVYGWMMMDEIEIYSASPCVE